MPRHNLQMNQFTGTLVFWKILRHCIHHGLKKAALPVDLILKRMSITKTLTFPKPLHSIKKHKNTSAFRFDLLNFPNVPQNAFSFFHELSSHVTTSQISQSYLLIRCSAKNYRISSAPGIYWYGDSGTGKWKSFNGVLVKKLDTITIVAV